MTFNDLMIKVFLSAFILSHCSAAMLSKKDSQAAKKNSLHPYFESSTTFPAFTTAAIPLDNKGGINTTGILIILFVCCLLGILGYVTYRNFWRPPAHPSPSCDDGIGAELAAHVTDMQGQGRDNGAFGSSMPNCYAGAPPTYVETMKEPPQYVESNDWGPSDTTDEEPAPPPYAICLCLKSL